MVKHPIYTAIWDLGMAIKKSGVEPGDNLAIKLRKPAFDRLVDEIASMRGPLDPPKTDPRMTHVMVANIKVTRAE